MEFLKHFDVFAHVDYRSLIHALLDKSQEHGVSARALAKHFGLGSPNYLQQIAAGNRNLTLPMAQKIAKTMGLNQRAADYFLSLVKLNKASPAGRKEIENALFYHRRKASEKKIVDPTMSSSWLHGTIFELADTPGFEMTVENVYQCLKQKAPREEIKASIEFLISKRYIVPAETKNVYRQNLISLEKKDDVRILEVLANHARYLDMAKHRLHDDADDREVQGLTMAIAIDKLPVVKQRIRQFMASLREELDASSNKDTVVRIQFCAFKLAETHISQGPDDDKPS